MALPATTNQRELITGFKKLGWLGPTPGGKHKLMRKGMRKQHLPHTTIDRTKLKDLLKQAAISEQEWMGVI